MAPITDRRKNKKDFKPYDDPGSAGAVVIEKQLLEQYRVVSVPARRVLGRLRFVLLPAIICFCISAYHLREKIIHVSHIDGTVMPIPAAAGMLMVQRTWHLTLLSMVDRRYLFLSVYIFKCYKVLFATQFQII